MVRKTQWLLSAYLLIVLGVVGLIYALVVTLTQAGPITMTLALVVFGVFCLGLGLLLRKRLKASSSGPEDEAS